LQERELAPGKGELDVLGAAEMLLHLESEAAELGDLLTTQKTSVSFPVNYDQAVPINMVALTGQGARDDTTGLRSSLDQDPSSR